MDFHGERRSNATHQSTTDPEARLLRKGKGKEAKLVFMAHALMGNRHGMLVDFQTTQATGTAERDIVPVLVDQAKERGFHPKTLGGDKGYDTGDCVAVLRRRGVTPHVAQNTNGRSSAIDGRTTRHPGYAVSQRIRKRVEEIFGWMKTVGGFRKTRYRGLDRTGLAGYLVGSFVRCTYGLGARTCELDVSESIRGNLLLVTSIYSNVSLTCKVERETGFEPATPCLEVVYGVFQALPRASGASPPHS